MRHKFMSNIVSSITGICIAVILYPGHIVDFCPHTKVAFFCEAKWPNNVSSAIGNDFAFAVKAAPQPSFYTII
jgi:hypothetical protein